MAAAWGRRDAHPRPLADLTALIALVRGQVSTAEPDERREAEEDVLALEREVQRRPPRKALLREMIQSSRSLAEGVAGDAAFAGLLAWPAS